MLSSCACRSAQREALTGDAEAAGLDLFELFGLELALL